MIVATTSHPFYDGQHEARQRAATNAIIALRAAQVDAAHNEMPALLAHIAELEASELKSIGERDEWSDLFDTICGYLGVETEYSNIRSVDDVLIECGERIGSLLAAESDLLEHLRIKKTHNEK